jgi:hypothetical protein
MGAIGASHTQQKLTSILASAQRPKFYITKSRKFFYQCKIRSTKEIIHTKNPRILISNAELQIKNTRPARLQWKVCFMQRF